MTENCKNCDGSGYEKSNKPGVCNLYNGSIYICNDPPSYIYVDCTECYGTGYKQI